MKCPFCFRPLDGLTRTWLLRDGEDQVDPIATRFVGDTVVNKGTVTDQRPPDARGPWQPGPAGRREPMLACPTCHFGLPPDILSAQVTCIAMAGARTTGKSLYIAVVVKQLKRLANALGTVLEPADETTRRTYRSVYETPLYVQRGLMPSTAPTSNPNSHVRTPLIFSMGIVRGQRRYIVLRDVAGEELEEPPAEIEHLTFLRYADGILFMFDPLAVPAVRGKLANLIPLPVELGGQPELVLGTLLRLLNGHTPPISVVLSKFDALQALVDVEDETWRSIMSSTGAAFLRDGSERDPRYDDVDGQLLHEEVRSLLIQLGATDIVLALENPSSGRPVPFRFFAVSALGLAPEGSRLDVRGIAPFRCLDPLKWALWMRGVLPA